MRIRVLRAPGSVKPSAATVMTSAYRIPTLTTRTCRLSRLSADFQIWPGSTVVTLSPRMQVGLGGRRAMSAQRQHAGPAADAVVRAAVRDDGGDVDESIQFDLQITRCSRERDDVRLSLSEDSRIFLGVIKRAVRGHSCGDSGVGESIADVGLTVGDPLKHLRGLSLNVADDHGGLLQIAQEAEGVSWLGHTSSIPRRASWLLC